mmetsp:Transcript_3409/g.13181  ORF Transcript_3409/g.13181 Transcript_3409/m.13181 type:complete len:214 (-) Transcript_3409:45-686(-)
MSRPRTKHDPRVCLAAGLIALTPPRSPRFSYGPDATRRVPGLLPSRLSTHHPETPRRTGAGRPFFLDSLAGPGAPHHAIGLLLRHRPANRRAARRAGRRDDAADDDAPALGASLGRRPMRAATTISRFRVVVRLSGASSSTASVRVQRRARPTTRAQHHDRGTVAPPSLRRTHTAGRTPRGRSVATPSITIRLARTLCCLGVVRRADFDLRSY